MQLKGFAKSNHKIGIFVIIISIVALVLVCTSFAFYNRESNHVFISSTVGNFNDHDVTLAIVVNGESLQDLPSKGNYDVEVDCGDNAIGEWEYDEWGLEIKNITGKKVTCSLFFTTSSVYGIKRNISSPVSEWQRIGLSVDKVANAQVGTTAVRNDFDSIYPWSDIKTYNYDTGTKRRTAWIGEAGFTFTPTGNVEVLTYIPEFYYRRYQENGYEYILISATELDGFTKSEEFSVGRYTMSHDSSGAHSRSNKTPESGLSLKTFRNYATALGTDFQQLDYHYFIIQFLYLVEYANYNAQATIGFGVSGNKAIKNSGECDVLGMHSGSPDATGQTCVIYRGIEDVYGNVFQYIDGINVKGSDVYINYDATTFQSYTYSGNYKKLAYQLAGQDGFVSYLGYDENQPLITFPVKTNKRAYITDYLWHTSEEKIVSAGGAYSEGYNSGFWCYFLLLNENQSYSQFGGRLLKRGGAN